MNINTKKYQSGSTRCDKLEVLLQQLKAHKFNRYLIVLAENPRIATDDLSKFIKSNNHHNASQYLNEIIIPLGWVIAKFPDEQPNLSWHWLLLPVRKALKLGIDKRLKRKIFRLLEAANDE